LVLTPSVFNGLRSSSLIRINKIATLDRTLAKGLLGQLEQIEIEALNNSLKQAFQL
jgi:mRNA interferase MazF